MQTAKQKENKMERELDLVKLGFVGVPAFLLALVVFFGSYTIVPTGHRGVVTHFGKVDPVVLNEGFHFKMPVYTTINKINVQIQKSESSAEAASKDIQKVTANVALNWNLDAASVNKMFQEIGDEDDIKERIIDPAVSEVLKAATAKRTAEEILTKRLELKAEIDAMLIERLSAYNITVRDISLVNLNFTADFNNAVEDKQIEEQKAKQAEYAALRAEKEALAAVNTAKGEAQAVEIRARAQAKAQELLKMTITGQILQQQAIEKWDGQLPQIMGGNGAVPFIDLKSLKSRAPAAAKGASDEE